MSTLDNKLQIYKMRISNLIEEHADAFAQAQDLHQKLQEAQEKISQLEGLLSAKNIQEKEPIVIDHQVEPTKK